MTYNFGIISAHYISFYDTTQVPYYLIGKHEKIGASESSERRILKGFPKDFLFK